MYIISIIYRCILCINIYYIMKKEKLAYCSECLNLISSNQDKIQFCTNCEKEVKVLFISHDK